MRAAQHAFDVGVGRVGRGEEHVGADALVEQVRVLRDETDRGVERLECEVAHVVTVDAHLALRDLVHARHEHRDRRLAGARRPDERDGLARLDDVSETSRRIHSLGSSPPGVPGVSSDGIET